MRVPADFVDVEQESQSSDSDDRDDRRDYDQSSEEDYYGSEMDEYGDEEEDYSSGGEVLVGETSSEDRDVDGLEGEEMDDENE